MSGRYEAILFDLDGTVIDSVNLIRESHRHAVRTVLGREMSDLALVANVGRPLADQMAVFSPDHVDALVRAYREWNHANTTALLRPYPGMVELLGELRAAGLRLAIVTSKSRAVAELAFAVLPVRDYFDVVIAADDTTHHKPDPEPCLRALAELATQPPRACMVGDAPFDLRSGAAAGCATIGVTWGFFDRAALAAEAPAAVVDRVDELAPLLTIR